MHHQVDGSAAAHAVVPVHELGAGDRNWVRWVRSCSKALAGINPVLPWGLLSIRTVDHANAWALMSSRLWKVRPGRKLVSTVQKLLSSPALRLQCLISWQRKTKPYCLAKASISGAISAWAPVPRSRARLVLSIMHWRAAEPQNI